ncbi:magnesium/cobalt transporter CorA [Candidatus Micrarchaeota archaeon]|nr:magnesium/cobalt transporter CorA [Candidatus Micrarchaeota archaeon]MBI5177616.1 magnesium/cobalt transporter CorA [Candidatus Micrarchaeota archaeon]
MIRAFSHGGGKVREFNALAPAVGEVKAGRHAVWLEVDNPSKGELESVAQALGLHHLTVEDVLDGNQRPKFEDYGSYAFIIARGISGEKADSTAQLAIYLGKNFVVTVNSEEVKGLSEAVRRVHDNPLLLSHGADFVAYLVLDAIVDGYFPVLEQLDDEVEKFEDGLFSSPQGIRSLESLFAVKRKLLYLRKAAWPMRDLLNALARRDFKYVSERNSLYFRDVYDHLLRVSESTDSLRDLVTSAMEGYLSVVSNNLNAIMKKLTSITAILLLPALIAGIYGMNFPDIPLIHGPNGFYYAMAIMAALTAGAFLYAKSRDWL